MALITRILIAGGILSCLYAFCFAAETPEPSFLVTFPALIRSDSEAKVCASLLSPNETVLMSIYLAHGDQKKMLHQETADKDFHRCFHFQAPSVDENSVQKIQVEVKGQTSNWALESLVKFKPKPAPITLIQTDKPIYSPGQTVHFRVVTMDTDFIPLSEEYPRVSLEDSRFNTIGQWLNLTSQSSIVQLSHVLNPEAPQGRYTLRVEGKRTSTRYHEFEVKKYVLPKFDVTLTTPKDISIGAEALKVEVCAKYTFGQPVPGKADLLLCRDLNGYYPDETTGKQLLTPCANISVWMEGSGCASHSFSMAMFTAPELHKKLHNRFRFKATVTEDGTGISRHDSKDIDLSYSLGKLAFFDTLDKIEEGAALIGKIKATHYNDTAIAHRLIHLFKGPRWNSELLLNLTTDSDGVAQFSINTTHFPDNFELIASTSTDIDRYVPHETPHYDTATKYVSRIRPASPASPDIPSSSFLVIKDVDEPLQCGKDVAITAKYVFIGETFHTDHVDIIYMVLSKGEVVHHGFSEAPVQGSQPVIEGEVSFQLPIRAEMAPSVKVLLYCVLPSEIVLAYSRAFSTKKCFKNKVALEFSPSKSVPGEQSSLQISAQPGSLCGLSAVDQSIFILESNKRLDVDKVTIVTQKFRPVQRSIL